jgi:E3 ubiquitin-protein ligase HUWE1
VKKDADDLTFLRMVGRLIGKAMFDGQLIPAYFIPPIFKSILGQKLSFPDLAVQILIYKLIALQ